VSLPNAREKQIPVLDLLIKREKGVGSARPVCCTGTIYDIRSSVIGGFSGNLFFARKSFCPLARVGRYIGRDWWEETSGVKRASEIEGEREREGGGGGGGGGGEGGGGEERRR